MTDLGARTGGTADPFVAGCMEYLLPIHRYVRASVQSPADAEDLTQDVFAQALASRHHFTGGDVGAWLYKIARNRIAMHHRRKDVERRGRSVLERERGLQTASPATELDAPTARKEFRKAVLAGLETLSEVEREALRLKFSDAHTNWEIARLLEVTPGHLGVILFRALKKMRKILEAHGHVRP